MPRRKFSIKARLILAYSSLFSLFLVFMGVGVSNWYIEETLRRLDTFLETEAAGITTVLATYFHDKVVDPGRGPGFQTQLLEYLNQRQDQPVIYKTTIYVFDHHDQAIGSSNEALRLDFRDSVFDPPKKTKIRLLLPDVELATIEHDGWHYRMIQMPIKASRPEAGYIRLACLMDPVDKSAFDFRLMLGLLIMIIIVAVVIGGIILTTWTLKPVADMSTRVEQVSENHLETRLDRLPGKDEISRLAQTFNRMLDRVQGAYQFQERLVDDLSHQLRTPLTVLRGSIEMALRKDRTSAEYRHTLEDNLSDIDRITAFLNTMLNLAKLDGQLIHLQYRPECLLEALVQVIDELEPLWVEHQLRFIYTLSCQTNDGLQLHVDMRKAMADPAVRAAFTIELDIFRFNQVLTNILSNAWKFAPIGGVIAVTCHANYGMQAEQCRLVLQNNGPPIPEQVLPHLFERFYHFDGQPKADKATPGVGPGLSIAESIIKLHGGTIRAFNPMEGGAAFEILMPRTHSTTISPS